MIAAEPHRRFSINVCPVSPGIAAHIDDAAHFWPERRAVQRITAAMAKQTDFTRPLAAYAA